jgi:hypothetical protein
MLSKAVDLRLAAARDRLMGKGWPNPSIEIGFRDSVYWLNAYLDNGDFTLHLAGNFFGSTVEEALSEMDKAIDQAPTRIEKAAGLADALANLTSAERGLLGPYKLKLLERTIERLSS